MSDGIDCQLLAMRSLMLKACAEGGLSHCCWHAKTPCGSSLQGGPLPEARARALFQQLISAVDYSHRLNVACRDIKLDNILLRCECMLGAACQESAHASSCSQGERCHTVSSPDLGGGC